jgi:hypothetical protein
MNPTNFQLLFGLAIVYHNDKKYREAIKIYEVFLNNKSSLNLTMKAT